MNELRLVQRSTHTLLSGAMKRAQAERRLDHVPVVTGNAFGSYFVMLLCRRSAPGSYTPVRKASLGLDSTPT